MLRGGEMATGKHPNVETSGTKPRAYRRNLAGFIGIFRAPRDTELHRATQSVIETGEIPSCGMGLMLVHEPCPIMEECGSIPPRNGIILLSEFRHSHPIPRRKHVGVAHDAREQRRGALCELHAERAERSLEQGRRLPGMGMRVGKQPPVGDEHRFDAGSERLTTPEAFFLASEE